MDTNHTDGVTALLAQLDGSGSDHERHAVHELQAILGPELPRSLLAWFRAAKRAEVRTSCMYYAARYARENEDAVQLGVEGLADRSKFVRYRACRLLAFAQKKSVLPALQDALVAGRSVDDVRAAIDAIESENHNYFLDREHTGKMFFEVIPRSE